MNGIELNSVRICDEIITKVAKCRLSDNDSTIYILPYFEDTQKVFLSFEKDGVAGGFLTPTEIFEIKDAWIEKNYLHIGTKPTKFEARPLSVDLESCKKYFEM